jgi:TrkA domain protein
MDVERTALPGIGLRHVFRTSRGRQLGVISHHSGRRELVVYDKEDPDSCVVSVALTPDEANVLAELLGTDRMVERLAELNEQVEGLVTKQIPITADSPYVRRTLGETQARTRTGASIVAVVREGEVIVSPRHDFAFEREDAVVAVGTAEGTAQMAEILARG